MIESPYDPVEIPAVSVPEFLFGDLADADLDRPALIDGPSGAITSYRDLQAQLEAVAGSLAARGVRANDVVAIHLPNVAAFASVFHGILRLGAIATTVNVLFTAEDVEKQLRASGATMIITVRPVAAPALAAAQAVGIAADRVVVLDGDHGPEGHLSMADLLVGGDVPAVDFDPARQVAVLPYSSGTTGLPKGVMLSHTNLVANVVQCTELLRLGRGERVLAVLPFFHIYGMTVLLNLALRARATLVIMPRFDLREFLRLIDHQQVSIGFIAPPIAVALAKHPMVDEYSQESLTCLLSGAAPLDADLGRAVADRLGIEMLQGYGMTELSPVSHLIPRGQQGVSLSSSGTTVPNTVCRIVDSISGRDVDRPAEGLSAAGELWVKGPQVMLGYLGDQESTDAMLDADGFLHTGDIARVDTDGNVYIVDRLKELIKYKGYQVPPAELEALLLNHPAVADVAVVGVSDAEGEEIPKAFVVAADESLTADQVMTWVAERVAPYKRVRSVEFIESVPKSASGKILRKDLRGS